MHAETLSNDCGPLCLEMRVQAAPHPPDLSDGLWGTQLPWSSHGLEHAVNAEAALGSAFRLHLGAGVKLTLALLSKHPASPKERSEPQNSTRQSPSS